MRHAARVAAIVLVAQDRDARARRARDVEAIDGDVAARGELDVVLALRRPRGEVIFAPSGLRERIAMRAAAVPEVPSQPNPAYVPSSTVTVSPAFTLCQARCSVCHGLPESPEASSLPPPLTKYSFACATDGNTHHATPTPAAMAIRPNAWTRVTASKFISDPCTPFSPRPAGAAVAAVELEGCCVSHDSDRLEGPRTVVDGLTAARAIQELSWAWDLSGELLENDADRAANSG